MFFLEDVRDTCWDDVLTSNYADNAIQAFNKLFIDVSNWHAPLKKRAVREVRAGWIDTELKDYIAQRDKAKKSSKYF